MAQILLKLTNKSQKRNQRTQAKAQLLGEVGNDRRNSQTYQ